MSVVAVAGGTHGIGRAIVDAIKEQGKYQLIVLSRKADKETEELIGASIVAIDYANVDELVKVLETNNVHTVISTLGAATPAESEKNLILAADKANSTKRFIPSVFGIKYRQDQAGFHPAINKLSAMAALEETSLEWTIICNGFFLDYWGMPKVKTYLTPITLLVDIAAGKAGIPGSGDIPVVFTYSHDAAKFTAAALTLDKWEKELYAIGAKITLNDLVKVAEDVRGVKFDVTHDSLETLRSGKITELPGQIPGYAFFPKEMLQGMFAVFGLMFEEGQFNFEPKQSLNDLFPEIKPVSVKEIVEIGWKQ
ncbi:hypothetical protein EDB81DRAFT_925388 [Dactylonectria macrodidyma]|uniref:NmrA-like domain-containing protein n=1 Tax=Dactylonectria macrodidyma TaxID=307937 RepID=A0A9P9JCT6_9HYPO|nr:hypothetical protein EDB81DRAFT_925388 [Dactylonectria macrodidyma]